MISLIPYVRETFRRHLNPKQAVLLIEFDKLKRVRISHVYNIHYVLIYWFHRIIRSIKMKYMPNLLQLWAIA